MARALLALMIVACVGCSAAERPAVAPAAPARRAAAHPRSARDRALGAWIDRRLARRFDLYADRRLAAYVAGVGARVAGAARCAGCRFTFRLIDDPEPNAFALPGGFVYVTRGLVALLDSEAELAAILGHEIGHVVARHALREWAREGDPLAGADRTSRFELVEYSRDNEREADSSGVTLAARAGYDARALSSALADLADYERAQAEAASPWDDHPATPARAARAAVIARAWPRGRVGRARYLRAIDGMVVGDDPRRGYVAGRWFVRPDAGFRLQLPATWTAACDGGVLVAVASDKREAVVLVRTRYVSVSAARDAVYDDGVRHDELVAGTLGGYPALRGPVFDERGTRSGSIAIFQARGRVFLAMVEGTRDALGSLAPTDGRSRVDSAPRHLWIARLSRATTARALVGSGDALAPFCLLNHVTADERLAPGRWVKRVRSVADHAAPPSSAPPPGVSDLPGTPAPAPAARRCSAPASCPPL